MGLEVVALFNDVKYALFTNTKVRAYDWLPSMLDDK